jgi:hypothetical protein
MQRASQIIDQEIRSSGAAVSPPCDDRGQALEAAR